MNARADLITILIAAALAVGLIAFYVAAKS
jgi:hypothetical protein